MQVGETSVWDYGEVIYDMTSKRGQLADALALSGDEGRGKLRKAPVSG